ncbi:Bug family tripartite tricarboxylate transporter substrate binding protein [Caenimonas soli]|uniref:Bug family tripartite tricarboxylate transporter substrate binding protein n=1 Tax=Caenimonas soli TaxID=2735555 RepID=UPI001555D0E6|nr:tripartite tricarboxylate transporter substrate binding protein [Caenimonas soli]NPC58528.1 tripartite tricarboxylate transporter substrate binding protein [Caenimonas soli]
MNWFRTLSAGLLIGLCMFSTASAQNASDYPSRPIRIVVPFPPGGAIDTLARKTAEELRKRLNATVLVDNKPGAGTVLGTDAVAKAAPDGYTILLNAAAGIEQLPWMQKVPYDPMKDLQPVGIAATVPMALIVPSTLPAKSFGPFVEYSKSQRGKVSFGSLGNGSTAHIYGQILNAKMDAGAVHSAYKGDAPAMLDLVAGRIDYMFNNVASGISFQERGSVRVLGVTGRQRIAALPNVPTLAEMGLADFDLVGWYAFFAPAGTPRPIVEKLNAALRETYKTKDFADYFATAGLGASEVTAEQFTKQVHEEYDKWGRLIKAHNIKIE